MEPHELIALARRVLRDVEQDWMPEGKEWDPIEKAFAAELGGAIDDCKYEWLRNMEREKAERAMEAAAVGGEGT